MYHNGYDLEKNIYQNSKEETLKISNNSWKIDNKSFNSLFRSTQENPGRQTKGDGNCFFHATFGKWNKQKGMYIDIEAANRRARWQRFMAQFTSLADSRMPYLVHHCTENILEKFFDTPDAAGLVFRDTSKIMVLRKTVKQKIEQAQLECDAFLELLVIIILQDVVLEEKEKQDLLLKALLSNIQKDNSNKLGYSEIKEQILKCIENNNSATAKKRKREMVPYSEVISLLKNNLTYLKDKLREELKEYVLLLNIGCFADEKSYDNTHNIKNIMLEFLNDKEVYQTYVNAIQYSNYYIFTEEIPVLATLNDISIQLWFDAGENNYQKLSFAPDEQLLSFLKEKNQQKARSSNDLKAIKFIYHSGGNSLHYEKANKNYLIRFANIEPTIYLTQHCINHQRLINIIKHKQMSEQVLFNELEKQGIIPFPTKKNYLDSLIFSLLPYYYKKISIYKLFTNTAEIDSLVDLIKREMNIKRFPPLKGRDRVLENIVWEHMVRGSFELRILSYNNNQIYDHCSSYETKIPATNSIYLYFSEGIYYSFTDIKNQFPAEEIDNYAAFLLSSCRQLLQEYCDNVTANILPENLNEHIKRQVDAIIKAETLEEICNNIFKNDNNYFYIIELARIEKKLSLKICQTTLHSIKKRVAKAFKETMFKAINKLKLKNKLQEEERLKQELSYLDKLKKIEGELEVTNLGSKLQKLFNSYKFITHIEKLSREDKLFDLDHFFWSCVIDDDLNNTLNDELNTLFDFLNEKFATQNEKINFLKERILPVIEHTIYANPVDKSIIEVDCNFMSLNAITSNDKFKELFKDDIKEIRINAKSLLFLDYDWQYKGVNLVLIAPRLECTKTIIFDVSGTDAPENLFFPQARDGTEVRLANNQSQSVEHYTGTAGENGQHGAAGQSSGNIFIEGQIVNGHLLQIIANGGNGADGQKGGDGERGFQGEDGKDAEKNDKRSAWKLTRWAEINAHPNKAGKQGGKGGDGGRGGFGGCGGYAGQIIVNDIKIAHPEQNDYGITVICQPGKNGNSGENGKGGIGGSGGHHGADYAYQYYGRVWDTKTEKEDWGEFTLHEHERWYWLNSRTYELAKTREEVHAVYAANGEQGSEGQALILQSQVQNQATINEFRSIKIRKNYQTTTTTKNTSFSPLQNKAEKIRNKLKQSQQEKENLQKKMDNLELSTSEFEAYIMEALKQLKHQQITQQNLTVTRIKSSNNQRIYKEKDAKVIKKTFHLFPNVQAINDFSTSLPFISNITLDKYKQKLSQTALSYLEIILVKLSRLQDEQPELVDKNQVLIRFQAIIDDLCNSNFENWKIELILHYLLNDLDLEIDFCKLNSSDKEGLSKILFYGKNKENIFDSLYKNRKNNIFLLKNDIEQVNSCLINLTDKSICQKIKNYFVQQYHNCLVNYLLNKLENKKIFLTDVAKENIIFMLDNLYNDLINNLESFSNKRDESKFLERLNHLYEILVKEIDRGINKYKITPENKFPEFKFFSESADKFFLQYYLSLDEYKTIFKRKYTLGKIYQSHITEDTVLEHLTNIINELSDEPKNVSDNTIQTLNLLLFLLPYLKVSNSVLYQFHKKINKLLQYLCLFGEFKDLERLNTFNSFLNCIYNEHTTKISSKIAAIKEKIKKKFSLEALEYFKELQNFFSQKDLDLNFEVRESSYDEILNLIDSHLEQASYIESLKKVIARIKIQCTKIGDDELSNVEFLKYTFPISIIKVFNDGKKDAISIFVNELSTSLNFIDKINNHKYWLFCLQSLKQIYIRLIYLRTNLDLEELIAIRSRLIYFKNKLNRFEINSQIRDCLDKNINFLDDVFADFRGNSDIWSKELKDCFISSRKNLTENDLHEIIDKILSYNTNNTFIEILSTYLETNFPELFNVENILSAIDKILKDYSSRINDQIYFDQLLGKLFASWKTIIIEKILDKESQARIATIFDKLENINFFSADKIKNYCFLLKVYKEIQHITDNSEEIDSIFLELNKIIKNLSNAFYNFYSSSLKLYNLYQFKKEELIIAMENYKQEVYKQVKFIIFMFYLDGFDKYNFDFVKFLYNCTTNLYHQYKQKYSQEFGISILDNLYENMVALQNICLKFYITQLTTPEVLTFYRLNNKANDLIQLLETSVSQENNGRNRILVNLLYYKDEINLDASIQNFKKKINPLLNFLEKEQLNYLLQYVSNKAQLTEVMNIFIKQPANSWQAYMASNLTERLLDELFTKSCLKPYDFLEEISLIQQISSELAERLLEYNKNLADINQFKTINIDSCLDDLEIALKHCENSDALDDFLSAIYLLNLISQLFKNASSYEEHLSWVEFIYLLLHRFQFSAEDSKINVKNLIQIIECARNISSNFAIKIVKNTLPENWLSSLIHEELLDNILILLNKNSNTNEYINEIPEDISILLKSNNLKLLSLINKKLIKEINLINEKSRLATEELKNILKIIAEILIDDDTLEYLAGQPINSWNLILRKKLILSKLEFIAVDYENQEKLRDLFQQLLEKFEHKVVGQLIEVISRLEIFNPVELLNMLHHFINGDWPFNQSVVSQLSNIPFEKWSNHFLNNEKDSHLIDQSVLEHVLLELNQGVDIKDVILDEDLLVQNVAMINEFFNNKKCAWEIEDDRLDNTTMQYCEKSINLLNSQDIKQWVKFIKKRHNPRRWLEENIHEVIAVIMRGIQLFKNDDNYRVRDTQLTALWLYLDATKYDRGRLGQVATGEGKTLISAMLAIIQGLLGYPVNIITSSPVLAKRDADNNRALFQIFRLSVSNNCDKEVQKNLEKRKERYQAVIIYGDVSSFQRDKLLTDFFGKNIIGNRSNEIIIVDEVDSLLLDKNDNTLYMSHEIPDLRHLRLLYIEIWCSIHGPGMELFSEENSKSVRKRILKKIRTKELSVPSNLLNFIRYRLPKWIEMAYSAKEMNLDDQYVLKKKSTSNGKKEIVIMDNETGVAQLDTQWNNGLHQFLQLLTTRKLTNESLKAIYMSNLSYFQEYRGRIYGITGTLGLATDKQLLTKLYEVDFFKLPRFKKYLFKEELGKVVDLDNQWKEEIQNEIEEKISKGRSVLIICENRDKAKNLHIYLKENLQDQKENIEFYKSAFKEFELGTEKKPLSAGKIIISTNLAGRGTDLIIDEELEKNGGLHVILTYMPINIRIEEQAFGRAARQGKPGTGKYIVHDLRNKTLDELRKQRDVKASKKTEKFRTSSLQIIDMEHKLFIKFSATYKTFKKQLLEKDKPIYGEAYVELQLNSFKTHWAFWLDSMESKLEKVTELGEEAILAEYNAFEISMANLLKNENILKLANLPHDILSLANMFFKHEKFDNALTCVETIIKQYPKHAEIAYLLKAKILALKDSTHNYSCRKAMRQSLKAAKNLINERMQELAASSNIIDKVVETAMDKGKGQYKNDFKEQTNNEIQLYRIHLHTIDILLGTDFNSSNLENVVPLAFKEISHQLFLRLLNSPFLIRPYRLNKHIKIKTKKEHKILLIENTLEKQKIILPLRLQFLQDAIFTIIEETLKDQNNSQNQLFCPIEPKLFEKALLSQESLWQLLFDNQCLQKSNQNLWKIKVNYEDADNLEFGFHGVKLSDGSLLTNKRIIKILIENDTKDFSQQILPMLTAKQFNIVRQVLEEKNWLLPTQEAELILKYDYESQQFILPPALIPYQNIFLALFKDQIEENASSPLRMSICDKDIPLPTTVQEAQNLLWDFLLQQQVIKSHKVNFSLQECKSDTIEKRLHEIQRITKKIVEGILKEIPHEKQEGSEFDKFKIFLASVFDNSEKKFIKAVTQALEESIGKLKTMKEFKGDIENLQKFFTAHEFPPEANTFIEMLLGEVLVVSDVVSRWNWGAFAVAMLGLAEVAVGIALEVCTFGIGAPLGAMLICEGISDMMYATIAGLTGTFSWKAYAVNKTLSIVTSAITVLTLGMGVGLKIGANTLEVAGIEVLKYAARRIGIEVAKAAAIKVATIGLEKICSQLPHEIQLRLGEKIIAAIDTIFKTDNTIGNLKNTMANLFCVLQDDQTAQSVINNCVAEVFNESQGNSLFNQIVAIIFSLAEQIPNQIILNSGGNNVLLLAALVSTVVNSLEHGLKFYQLVKIIPNALQSLETSLGKKLAEAKQNNPEHTLNQSFSTTQQQFIDGTIQKTKEQLSTMMLNRIAHEIVMPNVSKGISFAVNRVSEKLAKKNPNPCKEKEQKRRIKEIRKSRGKNKKHGSHHRGTKTHPRRGHGHRHKPRIPHNSSAENQNSNSCAKTCQNSQRIKEATEKRSMINAELTIVSARSQETEIVSSASSTEDQFGINPANTAQPMEQDFFQKIKERTDHRRERAEVGSRNHDRRADGHRAAHKFYPGHERNKGHGRGFRVDKGLGQKHSRDNYRGLKEHNKNRNSLRQVERLNYISNNINLTAINNLNNESFKKILLNHNLVLIQTILIEKSKKRIKNFYQDVLEESQQKSYKLKTISEEKTKQAIAKKKKTIQVFIALIIVNLKISVEIGKLENLLNNSNMQNYQKEQIRIEEIMNEAELLCERCFATPTVQEQYRIVVNYLNKFSKNHSNILNLLKTLKEILDNYNKLTLKEVNDNNQNNRKVLIFDNLMIQRRNDMLKVVEKTTDMVFTTENSDKFFNLLESRNFSQCGKLLKNGQLGEGGFIIGSTIEGLMQCHLQGEQSKQMLYKMVHDIVSKTLESEEKLMTQVKESEVEKTKLMTEVKNTFKEQLGVVADQVKQLLEMQDKERTQNEALLKELREKNSKFITEKAENPNFSDARLKILADALAKDTEAAIVAMQLSSQHLINLINTTKDILANAEATKQKFLDIIDNELKGYAQFKITVIKARESIVNGMKELLDNVNKQNVGTFELLAKESIGLVKIALENRANTRSNQQGQSGSVTTTALTQGPGMFALPANNSAAAAMPMQTSTTTTSTTPQPGGK